LVRLGRPFDGQISFKTSLEMAALSLVKFIRGTKCGFAADQPGV